MINAKSKEMKTHLTADEWAQYEQEGYLVLKALITPDWIERLQNRIDAIMLGKADTDYDSLLMQLDSENGEYDSAGKQSSGFKGATRNYRKIQELEWDAEFLNLMRHPLFEDACNRAYANSDVSCYRAMFMNKPAKRGTFLPFHQDRWNFLDRDQELTVWVALDPATRENGCVQVIPRTHRELINPSHASGFLTDGQAAEFAPKEKRVYVELEAGDVVLLHNHLIHGSDRNHSSQSRRAFSACFMDSTTRHLKNQLKTYPVIFGENAIQAKTRETTLSQS